MIYNMMFGFTSIGGKVYTFSNTGKGFIHREFMDKIIIVTIVYCHNVMTNQNLLNESTNEYDAIDTLHASKLMDIFNNYNELVKSYRMVR
uniref:Uncharacterized protein n=1 Tax=Lactuca sativa TaxID=4236 RepID=A0A9R1WX40_LACSA|nr:hypothetical protein LSAT_V11C800388360 [Lactuca sativa]